VPFDRKTTRAAQQLHGVDSSSRFRRARPSPRSYGALVRRIVFDLYDPKPLQVLEPSPPRRDHAALLVDDCAGYVMAALSLGDYLICASERQRDLWIGACSPAGDRPLYRRHRRFVA